MPREVGVGGTGSRKVTCRVVGGEGGSKLMGGRLMGYRRNLPWGGGGVLTRAEP